MNYLYRFLLVCIGVTFSLTVYGAQDKYTKSIDIIMETDKGNIALELYPDAAPVTVANFIKNIKAGYYRDGQFYRASRPDNNKNAKRKILTLIQGGKNDDLAEVPGIVHETTSLSGISHLDGVISMARLEPGTAGTEFFICIGDNSGLDNGSDRYDEGKRQGYATFGRVTSGMEVVLAIQQMPTGDKVKDDDDWFGQQVINDTVRIKRIIIK